MVLLVFIAPNYLLPNLIMIISSFLTLIQISRTSQMPAADEDKSEPFPNSTSTVLDYYMSGDDTNTSAGEAIPAMSQ